MNRRLLFECLETRRVLAASSYVTRMVSDNSIGQSIAEIEIADINGDSRDDVVIASSDNTSLDWIDSRTGLQTRIPTGSSSPISLVATDVDGDGDLDIVSGNSGGLVNWHENIDGNGNFGLPVSFAVLDELGPSVNAGDLDGDGDTDLVVAGTRTFAWIENTNGVFSSVRVIDAVAPFGDILLSDIDGDDDLDIIMSIGNSDRRGPVAGGDGFVQVQTLNDYFASDPHFVDADRDGDLDLLVTLSARNDSPVATLFENTSDSGMAFERGRVIDIETNRLTGVADIDGDGFVDIISSAGFLPTFQGVFWHRNIADFEYGAAQPIVSMTMRRPNDLVSGDVDGDGDLDLVVGSGEPGIYGSHFVSWYENIGMGEFGSKITIGELNGARKVELVDMDGDGDLDIVATGDYTGADSGFGIYWYENTDGNGGFGEPNTVTDLGGVPLTQVVDFDGDGDHDVVYAHFGYGWFENHNDGQLFEQHVFVNANPQMRQLSVADLDGDGLLDLLLATFNNRGPNDVSWSRNLGDGSFGSLSIVSNAFTVISSDAVDLDGDGDFDILAAGDGGVFWFENQNGRGNFSTARQISSNTSSTIAIAVDMNNDRQLDVVYRVYEQDDVAFSIAWRENLGDGKFGEQQLIATDLGTAFTGLAIRSITPGDFDGDGNMDIASAVGDDILWHEYRVVGDSNDDGVFNSSDFVSIFQASEYEDIIPLNSTYDEGDWNQDGDFNSSDFVFAFQAATYVAAAKPRAFVADRATDAFGILRATNGALREPNVVADEQKSSEIRPIQLVPRTVDQLFDVQNKNRKATWELILVNRDDHVFVA